MNITVVGGGTAGWLAAYMFLKSQPGLHSVTVIESSSIGIIGAGEGSTGFFSDVLNGFYSRDSINIDEFVSACDATNKIGIKFRNWNGDGKEFFSPLDGSPTAGVINDFIFKYVLAKYGRYKAHLASRIGLDYELERNWNRFNSFHFNAHKVGQFFKNICVQEGIKYFDNVVQHVNLNSENGHIESLLLDNGQTVGGDFFIDCTGFARVLMKALDVKWEDWSNHLPVNTAMPFLLDYKENDKIFPWTTSTALNAGWMWDIPLQNRRGCGYVYNKNFISKEEAKREIETLLGREITPIKFIDFVPGRSETFWKKNALCLGLASCFVEPLQATSIHTTVAQLVLFVMEFLKQDKNEVLLSTSIDAYNRRTSKLYDLNLDFVSMHYQGGRTDTAFWRYIKENKIVSPYAQDVITRTQNKLVSFHDIGNNFGAPAIGLWNWTMSGLGIITPEQAKLDLDSYGIFDHAERQYLKFLSHADVGHR